MTNTLLKSLIDKLNKNKTDGLIHLRPLSSTVDFAKVWPERPKPTDTISHPDGPYKIYFIKNSKGLYVAAVVDMWHDLHWFVDNKHRRQGHLTGAMRETILFHLFQDREEQRVTIIKEQTRDKNYNSSKKVALSLGFVTADNNNYFLTKNKYQSENYNCGQNTEITKEQLEELKKRINFVGRSLWLIHSEVEMKLGNTEYAEELKELVHEIKKHVWRLEDTWREKKREQV
jgi:hypothetical protein